MRMAEDEHQADCVFCRIVAGEIPAAKVHEDELVVAFRDLHPKAPTHVLVIPRKHVPSLNALSAEDDATVGHLVRVAARVAAADGCGDRGYRLVANCGPDAGQSVDHLHFHLLGGQPLGWPPWPSG
jgi:histidine triad (HIT) family protein